MITPSPALTGVAELVPGFEILVEDLAHLTNEQLKARALEAFPKLRERLPEAERPAMTMAEELIQQGRAESRAEGLAEGRAEGRAEALRHLLLKQLARKFGGVPPEYGAAIETGTTEQLERYAERIIVVDTLPAVFAND